ncbi:MAG TPA: DoxX family protein [Opitutaceae bacterium]|nr:DoxX family protein [Opitutaceae bacterium]
MKFLHLNFLPRSANLALLGLRVWFGGSLLALHGWGKLTGFSAMSSKFADPFGLGSMPSLVLATFAELVCAGLIVLGLFTRTAALIAALNMAVAFAFAHKGRLMGTGNGELAFLYLGAFVALFLVGAGKFSVDANIGAKT